MVNVAPKPLARDPTAHAPSPRAALLGLVLIVAAVLIAATRVVGTVNPVEIDIFKTADGWHVAPDPKAATVVPSKSKKDALDCAYMAPTAQGEELYMEVATIGHDGTTLLPGAPIQSGWNKVLLEPASQFLSVRLQNYLFRWERPGIAIVRGGPTRPSAPPDDIAIALAAAVGLACGVILGRVSGGDALRDVGLVLLLLTSAATFANEQSPYRLFLSGESALLVGLVPTLFAYVGGRVRRRREQKVVSDAATLPSMGGARY